MPTSGVFMPKTPEILILAAIMNRGFANNSPLASDPRIAKIFYKAVEDIKDRDNLSSKGEQLFLQNDFKQCWYDYAKDVARGDNVITAAELLSDLNNPSRKGGVDHDLVTFLQSLKGDTEIAKINQNAVDPLEIAYTYIWPQYLAKK
jgi:hypothetical protein